ncbi:hypothetical protein Krac_9996 [Ktedonobacter racemifer DSM 44963]|uniref:Uncharacterized protein n=1 Tax=Ktedonobacter racemifer DSM 44963 TaxID=485913 RepID=D6TES2_KTERA|nr:hypothetical protein Krac_9996 [Ktedonobacter racemifer DSM 44963]
MYYPNPRTSSIKKHELQQFYTVKGSNVNIYHAKHHFNLYLT